MHVIIGGCGRVGADLADRLSAAGHDVVVVDRRDAAFDRIGSGFNGDTVHGDITDRDVLVRAGIERADALVAVTDLDNANLMAVELAKELYGVTSTVARLFNPQREDSYRKMGVHYVCGTRLVAKSIMNELHTEAYPLHIQFDDGDIEVVEVRVAEGGHNLAITDLERSGKARVAALKRGLRVRIPRPDDRLAEGDVLVLSVAPGAHRHLRGIVDHPFAEL